MTEKYFDRREAEELLPTIAPWIEEARGEKQKVDALQSELTQAASRIIVLGGTSPPFASLLRQKTEHDQAAARLAGIVNRIQETGCLVKDLDLGLVDFPSLLEGEVVYLCWKLGEERIAFWHGIEEGFAGRKPLDEPAAGPTPPTGPRFQ
jgi:hypothetical protein